MLNDAEPELSVVMPAYEEAANLEFLLPRIHQAVAPLASSYEIVVVDSEKPRDNTADVCARNATAYVPRVGGAQYGDAIRTALKSARGRYVVIMDADGSHAPDFIQELWKFRDDYDLVIASRYVPGGKTENPWILIFLSLVVNVAFRLVLSLKCHDVSNSFRLYRGEMLRALTLECHNFDIVEEILVKLNPKGRPLRIKEVPFTFEKRKAGSTKRNLVTFAIGYVGTIYKLWCMKRKFRT